jgi:hypothetical protein
MTMRASHDCCHLSATSARSTGALASFDDLARLRTYLRHPAHIDLGARFGQSLSGALVYDFEVGGVEELQAGRFF